MVWQVWPVGGTDEFVEVAQEGEVVKAWTGTAICTGSESRMDAFSMSCSSNSFVDAKEEGQRRLNDNVQRRLIPIRP
jgi:hypothetical protein